VHRLSARDEFIFSFNGDLEFKDDLDLDAYGRCTPTEKAELDRLLAQKLPEGDPRVARAIAALWPADKAAAALTDALSRGDGEARVEIARSLRGVSDGVALNALRAALFDDSAAPDARVQAATALAEIDGAPVNFSLKAALDEPVPELQRRAAELLFRRLGLEARASTPGTGAALLSRLLQHDDAAVRAQALDELKRVVDTGSAALAGYAAGATPATLADLGARVGIS
jgi:hypothetical protein